MYKRTQIFPIVIILMLLASCLPNTPQAPAGLGETQAAYTMEAALTQAAFQTVEAKLTEVSRPSSTPSPEESPSPEANTPIPITTQLPTVFPQTLAPAEAPSSATGTLCNQIGSIVDVSVPDGTAIKPGATFTKIWRLKNNGTCTWTKTYDLVFSNGVDLTVSGDKEFPLPRDVKPGESVDVSVLMQAPGKVGDYISFWQLQDQYGKVFGAGPKGQNVFWVKIKSGGSSEPGGNSSLIYNLADSACYASWFTSNGAIKCPGTIDPADGSVTIQSSVKMADNSNRSEAAIIMVPNKGGAISGQFPAILINRDNIFTATIGCMGGHPDCSIQFTLGYSTTNGQTGSFGSWSHTSNGNSEELNIDLNRLAGSTASLILTVNANNQSEDNIGYWITPRVWH